MTCKDCIHYKVCLLGACINGATGTCLEFKDESRFIELPCKIGDTVYIIDEDVPDESEPYILDVKVLQFILTKHGVAVDLDLPLGIRLSTWAKVGKNVYLTEEEAEKALEERSGQ